MNQQFRRGFAGLGIMAVGAVALGTTLLRAEDAVVSSGSVVAVPSGAMANMSAKTARELAVGLRKTKNLKEKGPYLKALHSFKPRTEDDVKQLADIASEITDPRDPVNEAAYRALSNVKPEDQQLEPVFRKMLNDKRPGVRYMALKNCGVLKSKQAMPSLIKQLRETKKAKTQEESWPLMGAEEGLALYGKEALPDLVKLYKESSDTEVKDYARETIRQIRDKEAADELLNIVKDRSAEGELRETAIETLGTLRAEKVAGQLIELYAGESGYGMRSRLIGAIGKSNSNLVIPFLRKIIVQEPNILLRSRAMAALGEFRSSETISILTDVLKAGKELELKKDAASILHSITGKSYDLETGREK